MVRCPHCGADLFDTDQYCDECGTRVKPPARTLASAGPGERRWSRADSDFESPRPAPKSLASAPPATSSPVRPREASLVEPPTSATARLVVIRNGRLGREFPLAGTQWLIGRWDPERGVFPDLDLDADDPEATVSRRHAHIVYQDGQYLIEDLGSTNGTFINRGHRLIPGRRYVVQDGDEIIIGKTFLKFVIG